MTHLALACFSFCSRTVSVRHAFIGRSLKCTMRKRRTLKPSSVQNAGVRPATISKLKEVSRRPAAIAVAMSAVLAVVGLVAMSSAQRGAFRNGLRATLRRSADVLREGDGAVPTAPVYSARVLAEYSHDYEAFTQGLAWYEGNLYESTGLRGRSSLRHVDLETGKVFKEHDLRRQDFGEGLAISGEDGKSLIQLVWKTGKGYIYNRETMEFVSEFDYEGDGWGLASLPGKRKELFLSDGSSKIRVYHLDNGEFSKIREFTVRDGLKEVGLLNELEVVGDELWANVWLSDYVARIDLKTGLVTSWVDLRQILDRSAIPPGHQVDVLNGIAYDEAQRRVFVTGKLWPKLYSIQVTNDKVADNVQKSGNAFFLDPDRVHSVHQSVIGM